jgi:hypothetical protein
MERRDGSGVTSRVRRDVSGIVKPGDAKHAFSNLFNRRTRREQEQEKDRIFARTDKSIFVDANLRLDEWVLQPFRGILREKAGGQQRDHKFSDTKCTREAVTSWQTTGQARLKVNLVLYEKHLASLTFLTSVAGEAAGGGAAAERRRTTTAPQPARQLCASTLRVCPSPALDR